MTDQELGKKIVDEAGYCWMPPDWYAAIGRAARTILAPLPAPLPPICGMSVEKIGREFMRARGKPDHEEFGSITLSDARTAHRLAQPAPVVDPDAKAKRLAAAWTDVIHAKKRYSVPWDMMDETERDAWRAVAAAQERGE